ncbi:MAG: sulfite oxidase [bacterium]|nr:sulfite oxidase [bacterium]
MSPSGKNPAMIVREEDPLNAGPQPDPQCSSFLTPNDLFFVRNHAAVPDLDPAAYRLSVGGMVKNPLTLTLDELKNRYPAHSLPATLMCAGNRREELLPIGEIKGEVPWNLEAISTAEWRGVLLRDVLAEAEIDPGAAHIAFVGADQIKKDGATFGFGASIPLEKALNSDVLLAYAMNDQPLPPAHGFPVRGLVPGYIGARSVKWLTEIIVQAEPSDNYYQSAAYRWFPPNVSEDTADWGNAPMLGGLIVNAAICCPQPGETLRPGRHTVRGFGLATDGERLERVELSIDGGQTWMNALLGEHDAPYAWRLWQVEIDFVPGVYELMVRATDTGGHLMPEHLRDTWNFKGYMNNAWHRVRVDVRS